MQRSNEVGGTIEPDLENKVLHIVEGRKGGKDSVVIPVGTFQFHTHPNQCKSRGSCYFEFPSENDMSLIASDGMKGALAHFVFTHGKVYRVALSGKMRSRLANLPDYAREDEFQRIYDHFHELLDHLQEKASTEGITPEKLASYRQEWYEDAVREGFDVKMYDDPSQIVEAIFAIGVRR